MKTRSGKADERRKTQKRASVSPAIYEVTGQRSQDREGRLPHANVIGSQNGDKG